MKEKKGSGRRGKPSVTSLWTGSGYGWECQVDPVSGCPGLASPERQAGKLGARTPQGAPRKTLVGLGRAVQLHKDFLHFSAFSSTVREKGNWNFQKWLWCVYNAKGRGVGGGGHL